MQVQLVITAEVVDGMIGGIKIGGPVGNKGLCYGILELAKDAIRTFKIPDSPALEVPDAELTRKLVGVH